MTTQDLKKLADIVKELTGNVVQEKNYSMLESRIQTRMLHLKISSMEDYWAYYSKNEQIERETIQSLMTTHHTFFFREYQHFEALKKWIESNSEYLKNRWKTSQQPFRIWSAASSRGQEAYSLAMLLEVELYQKHGVEYFVIGTDIDKDSISYAKNGVYGLRDVNAVPRQFLGSLWKMGSGAVKEFAAVGPRLREKVTFESLNLFNVSSWTNKFKFDVIFCRNVFIYFSESDVQKIALSLASRLQPGGMFVSGISEPLRFKDWTLKGVGANCYISPTPETAAPTSVSSFQPEVSPEKYTVLAVDDSGTIQALLKKIFSQDPLCLKVESAMNGKEAAEKLAKGKYDLITLDIHMPVMTGIQFLEEAYKRDVHPPVIMISSVNRTDMELATKAISLGAFDYVEKPAMNNLQKSSTEILTKAKMALRSNRNSNVEPASKDFENTIAQKIIIPDASQCLRVVFASDSSRASLEHLVRSQSVEGRSPATVVCWGTPSSKSEIEKMMLGWTSRSVLSFSPDQRILKPNHFYVTTEDVAKSAIPKLLIKSKSLQILDSNWSDIAWCVGSSAIQVLVCESTGLPAEVVSGRLGIPVSDVTPSTSFPSLSAEYFANLRKAA